MERLTWIVWQLRTVSLWLIWSNSYMFVINRYSYTIMSVRTERNFSWHLTINDCPASWRFVWHLHGLISVSIHNSCVNSLTVLINIADCRGLSIRCVSYSDCLILSICSNLGCWYFTLTCCVAWHSWDIVVCPFTSCPLAVSYVASDFVNIGSSSQLSSLFNRLSLTIWGCYFDRSSN